MRAVLDDLAVMQDGDLVGIADGRDAVRDEDRRTSLDHFAKMIEDVVFSLGIHARECIVEDENSRIADNGARDGRALFLPAA